MEHREKSVFHFLYSHAHTHTQHAHTHTDALNYDKHYGSKIDQSYWHVPHFLLGFFLKGEGRTFPPLRCARTMEQVVEHYFNTLMYRYFVSQLLDLEHLAPFIYSLLYFLLNCA